MIRYIFFFGACLFIGTASYGQNSPSENPLVTLDEDSATLGETFTEITHQTRVGFKFNSSVEEKAHRVTIHVKNMPLNAVLELIFRDQPLYYERTFGTILIKLKNPVPAKIEDPRYVDLTGRIVNGKNESVVKATIKIKGTNRSTISNNTGDFFIKQIDTNAMLSVTHTAYKKKEIKLHGQSNITIQLEVNYGNLPPVFKTPADKSDDELGADETNFHIASTVGISAPVINKPTTDNLFSRLYGAGAGVLENKGYAPGVNQSQVTIGARSTMYFNPEPTIAINKIPYTGDLRNINLKDYDSVSILKDAAAASTYGVLSANSVIELIPKTGAFNQKTQVTFTANCIAEEKPDLFYLPRISSADYINIEKDMFAKGYYSGILRSSYMVISPVISLLNKNAPDADKQLAELANTDVRKEARKYLYHTGISQQYHMGISGGTSNRKYYYSLGYDDNNPTPIGNRNNRYSINLNNTFSFLDHLLELHAAVYFSEGIASHNSIDYNSLFYPYQKLKNADGSAAGQLQSLRQDYIDTAGGNQLLDWNYRPLDEIGFENDKTKTTAFHFTSGVNLRILRGLKLDVLYRYENEINDHQILHDQQTYFYRNVMNTYTQINAGIPFRPIKPGDILDEDATNREAVNVHSELTYTHKDSKSNVFKLTAGAEQRHITARNARTRTFGLTGGSSQGNIDFTTSYPLFYEPATPLPIPAINSHTDTVSHFYSFFGEAFYKWKNRYAVSLNIRKDESNYFGSFANSHALPVGAAGVSWEVSQEHFYQFDWLPLLRLRYTDGFCGNTDKTASSATTVSSGSVNLFGSSTNNIVSPPNPSLTYEKVRIQNVGVDFAGKNNRVWGSIEYYTKKASDLFAVRPVDPTSGFSMVNTNGAEMKGYGVDAALNAIVYDKKFRWYTTLLFSHVNNKVTKFNILQPAIWYYCDPTLLNPKEGRPLYSLYSFDFVGLDHLTGDPLGLYDHQVSKNYGALLSSLNFDNLVYHGSATPTFFGSIQNTFGWRRFELFVNVTYKAGYYFRRNSISYYKLYNGTSYGHPDYQNRWQNPGDELTTKVPSIIYPADPSRDIFYSYSSVLVEKGDHVRLQDAKLSYSIKKKNAKSDAGNWLQIYLYSTNLIILWRANKKGIDPDFVNALPNPKNISIGVKATF